MYLNWTLTLNFQVFSESGRFAWNWHWNQESNCLDVHIWSFWIFLDYQKFMLSVGLITENSFCKNAAKKVGIWLSLSCVLWCPGYTWCFTYLQKGTQSLETLVHMTNLTRSDIWRIHTKPFNSRWAFLGSIFHNDFVKKQKLRLIKPL